MFEISSYKGKFIGEKLQNCLVKCFSLKFSAVGFLLWTYKAIKWMNNKIKNVYKSWYLGPC